MRILALSGSPRGGGRTERLLASFLEGARRAGARVERVDLRDLELEDCSTEACAVGCCTPTIDEVRRSSEELCDRIQAADLLVVASPLLPDGLSRRIAVLLDRCEALRVWAAGGERARRMRSGRGILIAVSAARAGGAVGERRYHDVRAAAAALFENAGKVPSGLFVYPLTSRHHGEDRDDEAEMSALGERFARDPCFGVRGDLGVVH
jgi:multimeric flavodoxin WrbA